MPQIRMPRFRRRGRGPRLKGRWAGSLRLEFLSLTGATAGEVTVVDPTDYEQNSNLEQGTATLLRLVGQVNFTPQTTWLGGLVLLAFRVAQPGEPQMSILSYDNLTRNGDIIWQHVEYMNPFPSGGFAGCNQITMRVPFDIRVKRKLQGDEVRLMVGNNSIAGSFLSYAEQVRALIRVQ